MKPLVSAIVLSYNSKPFIEKCLDTLLAQDYSNMEILVIINGSNDGSEELIESRYGRLKKVRIINPNENLWFSRGNNFGIEQSAGEYIFCLNQDTVIEPDYVSRLIAVLEEDKSLGSVIGKLMHYKFDIQSKTRIIDSTALEIFITRRVIDRGQWEQDRGQYDRDRDVFGGTGAAAIYRRSALEEVKVPKKDGGFEYFDEDFTAYKEDIDLSWRLQLSGFKCRYVPEAILYHGRLYGRSWPTQLVRFILNRRVQPRLTRKLAFKNHYLMMIKNEVPAIFWRHFIFIFIREMLLLIYTLMFEQFQFTVLPQFFRQIPLARRKRKYIIARVKISNREVLSLFH